MRGPIRFESDRHGCARSAVPQACQGALGMGRKGVHDKQPADPNLHENETQLTWSLYDLMHKLECCYTMPLQASQEVRRGDHGVMTTGERVRWSGGASLGRVRSGSEWRLRRWKADFAI